MQFLHLLSAIHPLLGVVEPIIKQSQDAGRAIALGVGAGGGATQRRRVHRNPLDLAELAFDALGGQI